MTRTITAVFGAFFLLFAISALSAQQEGSPRRAPQRADAPQKQVHPNIDPQTAQSAAQTANSRSRARRQNRMPAGRPAQRAHGNAPVRVKERSPENPVRFAFAPRDQKGYAAPAAWDQNPSAGAVMSTLLTGEISPELIDWHVNQRKKAFYEKNRADRLARTEPQRAAHGRGEYGEMLHRMEFAWGNRTPRADEPAEMYDGYLEESEIDPSNGSILVQLLTGYKNGEIKEWKENRALMAHRAAPRGYPAMPNRPLPMYAYGQPLPQGAPLPAYAYGQPLPPNPPQAGYAYTSSRAVTGNIRQAELSTMPSGNGSLRVASGEEPRFVDDGFPAGAGAPRRNPIRQVSVEFRAPAPQNIVGSGESVSRAGQIRVYSEDEDGWSPVE
ncbi:MAG: hypothetical protein IK105_03005 [Thermoguttaceae bacterium]|nr:hypothetical protein [Thermoguttaceae bacterium]